jgi:hypothetical protein
VQVRQRRREVRLRSILLAGSSRLDHSRLATEQIAEVAYNSQKRLISLLIQSILSRARAIQAPELGEDSLVVAMRVLLFVGHVIGLEQLPDELLVLDGKSVEGAEGALGSWERVLFTPAVVWMDASA